ncbi:hypothetical protein BHM03_00032872, partial [Ensete ventricosum]
GERMGRGAYGEGNRVAAPTAAMPGWLGGLVEESFFVGCGAHESRKKNEKNIFCLDCCTSICPHCAAAHPSHPLLQVRRYVYNDVVRLDDLEKLIDCSYVQVRRQPFKGSGNICLTCDRILQEPFHFCSLSCKLQLPLSWERMQVDHVLLRGDDLSSILFRFSESDFAFPHFENLRMDGSDLLEDDDDPVAPEDLTQHRGGSASSNGGAPKKKKSGAGFFPQIVLSLSNRRKGAPHRSPLS